MSFSKEMLDTQKILEEKGHICFLPEHVLEYADNKIAKIGGSEGARRKIKYDLIRKHYQLIQNSDAILVLNYTKKDIVNYVGGNSFLEMGYAYVLNKKIFLLNPIPEMESIKQEMEAVQPIILNGDLNAIQ